MDRHAERMARFTAAGLYLVTGEALSNGRATVDIVLAAIGAGVRLVQLREKDRTERELLPLARDLAHLLHAHDGLLIIDDHVDIALASGADGVHLGNDDLDPRAARRLFPDGIIGVSTHNREEASRVESTGASYYNIGPIFPTRTKSWSGDFLGPAAIPDISACCPLPFTVMGGIKQDNVSEVVRAGARTVAVVTAVTGADDPARACRELLRLIRGS
jgi:thiamine-phosphate pyrophosphorylase